MMHGLNYGVTFRTLLHSDIQDLRALYKECFPVRFVSVILVIFLSYPESWFIDLAQNKSLISLAAVSNGHIIGVLVAKFSVLKDCSELV